MSIVIKVDNLYKKYKLGVVSNRTLADDIQAWQKKLLQHKKDSVSQLSSEDEQKGIHWALRGVSFDVHDGEVLGIIGRNGAGKSTLLKILSKVTAPTSGNIKIKGRIASLLEVGTGFHPELTGRENIFLNGAILGMRHSEIKRKEEEIIAFSGVEKFIDTPVKRYSSGMYVRLAFGVAAHLEPEILIVDEVLAVGDAEFQKRCLGKMQDVSKKDGRTVLFVSHNMAAVKALCSRAVLLIGGQLTGNGNTDKIIDQYLKSQSGEISEEGEVFFGEDGYGSHELKLRKIKLLNTRNEVASIFFSNEKITIEIEYDVLETLHDMRLILQVQTSDEQILFEGTSQQIEPKQKNTGTYTCKISIPSYLLNSGDFKVFIHAGIPGVKVLAPGKNFLQFRIEREHATGSNLAEEVPGILSPRLEWQLEKKQ